MSNTNTNLQTQTSNALHNAIMEAGGKDRPPMLAPSNYVQWKSKIKRYIDTKPNNEHIHYCLQNPPYKFKWTEKTVPVAEGSSETTTEGYMENYKNVSQDIQDQLNAEAEAVQIILTGIDNDIYSIVDACLNACEMWKAIERCYKMMNELVKNKCDITNHQVNVQFLLQLQPEWKRFVTLVKQSQELKTVSYHKLYDILKQHQNEVNEIRAERLARIANPLALLLPETEEKEIDKLMALISLSFKKIYKPTNNNLRTSSNTSRANQDNTSRINIVWARENVEQADWKDDTDDEPEDQELEAHYMYMAQIQEVTLDAADNSGPIFYVEPLKKVQNIDDNYNVFAIESEHPKQPESDNDTYSVEQDEHNIIIYSLDMSYDREQDDQDDNDDLAKERDLLAFLIAELKCEIDDSKNHNKFLETSNKALVDKLESFVKPEFLKKAQRGNPCLYDIDCYNDNLALMLAPESDETIRLAQESRSKLKEMVADMRYFNSLEHEVDTLKSQLETQKTQFLNKIDRLSREYYYADHMNAILGVYTTLYEFTDLQCDYVDQVVKCERLEKEFIKNKNDKAFKENQSKVFLKEREQYFEIQDLKAQLQDKGIALSKLKKLIEKMKGKYVETKFKKPSVIRQPNAFKSQRQSVLGQPAAFLDSLAKTDFSKSKSVTTINVSNDFSKSVTTQILPQNVKLILKSTNVIAPGMYKVHTKPNQTRTPQLPQDIRKTNKHVSFSTRVIPTTSVSIPQLKSNQLEDRVMLNNSQGKKQQFTPSGYKWKPKSPIGNVNANVSMPLGNASRTANIVEPMTYRCSKYMVGNLKLLSNFVDKFMGMVKFGNDQIAPIIGYGDMVQGTITIKRVYYVEGLNQNLFSVGQFCDADLEVAFRKSTCYIRDLKGNDRLTGSRGTDCIPSLFKKHPLPIQFA
ncbi:hypothetical protein Tco_1354141 [Tanacetum coccineum]